jgi:Kdo2-lipid IVA lauroyltransferase/acyltransferase
MKAAAFYLTLPFIYLVALLPFPLLYGLSDLMFVVLYGVVGYRKKVVRENLKKSFPEKSETELRYIERAYYRHLCDLILETFKLLTMRRSDLLKHCKIKNHELYFDMLRHSRSLVVALGHQGNWEWMGAAFAARSEAPLYVIYRPLSNKYFDRLMIYIRKRFGAKPVPANDILRKLFSQQHITSTTAFLSDQTPPPEHAYWVEFLNQQTPVYIGLEKIARKFNYPVGFAGVKKIRRGYYEVDLNILTEEPLNTTEGEITRMHTKSLEEYILEQPHTWLWSHRRWKHKQPETKTSDVMSGN